MIMQPFPAKTRKRVKFMSYTKIAAIYADSEALSGQTVTVGGWVRTIRDMKTFGFIELNDGSCFKNLQVVMEAGTLENYKDIAAQNVGAALIVTGTVVLTPEAKQPLELKAASIEVEGTSTSDYPLQKKRHSVEFLRTIQHLRPRTNLFSAVFRVRSVAAYAIHQFFQERGFVYVHTPIITASDCEGAGEMFRVTTLDPKNPPMTEDGEVDFSQYDYVADAIDTVSSKIELLRLCREAGVPVISCMGAGNKLDPTAFRVAPLEKTSVCPLARVMRRELKKRGITGVKAVYSTEEALTPQAAQAGDTKGTAGRPTPGSMAFVPSVAGLILAGEIVRDLLDGTQQ